MKFAIFSVSTVLLITAIGSAGAQPGGPVAAERAAQPAPAPAEPFGSGPCGPILAAFMSAPAESLLARYRDCAGAGGNEAERAWLEDDLALMRDLLGMRAAAGNGAASRLIGRGLVASASRLQGSYGTGPGQYNCTTFLLAALGGAGYTTSGLVQTYVNVDFPRYETLFARRDPRIKGVVTALVASGQGVEVTDLTALQPGDLVQYWYYHGGKLLGHSGIIAAARGGGRYDLLGAHKSLGRAGLLKNLDLSPGSKAAIFAVRPIPPAVTQP